jgi:signal peptidase I
MNVHTDPIPTPPDDAVLLDEPVSETSQVWGIAREIIETILLAAVIWLAVNFATARYVVDGQSMEPNLHTGQFLIVSRLAYKFGVPQRGDIIVFDFPGNPADDYVKRVIGLPGDTVTIQAGQIFINGNRLEEPYLPDERMLPTQGRWNVPDGSYFVLGDNRAHSSDSRRWGMLPEDAIIGKAWVSYWPPQDWGAIPHYDYAPSP